METVLGISGKEERRVLSALGSFVVAGLVAMLSQTEGGGSICDEIDGEFRGVSLGMLTARLTVLGWRDFLRSSLMFSFSCEVDIYLMMQRFSFNNSGFLL